MKYIAVVPNYWGRGDTIEQAKQQVRKAGATINARTPIKVYRVSDDGAHCDPIDGRILGVKGSTCELVESRNIKERK